MWEGMQAPMPSSGTVCVHRLGNPPSPVPVGFCGGFFTQDDRLNDWPLVTD